ncbi:hypothetical protein FTO70_10070 [Methanosarcina sp. KYL-1]|uniref:hypothetical protein n=1 Tax=Methanosarcina sp. KYL-1 TaxID=2602068 RepID=UPI0021014F4B|nr:hypothetical protein [Methanosarcina sp. KYL-1]MCQ1536019.1 hypothetical protein [Methanosarcina sp. KYL-1]
MPSLNAINQYYQLMISFNDIKKVIKNKKFAAGSVKSPEFVASDWLQAAASGFGTAGFRS